MSLVGDVMGEGDWTRPSGVRQYHYDPGQNFFFYLG
jgi:hypothetical protein